MEFDRQSEIFNPNKFNDLSVGIIGAGAIGSALALVLSKLGVKEFDVYDDDVVEEGNIPNQYYGRIEDGKPKAEAMERLVNLMSPYPTGIEEFSASICKATIIPMSPVVFCCIDSLDGRKALWEGTKKKVGLNKYGDTLYIDARIGGEYFQIFTVPLNSKEAIKIYEDSLSGVGTILPCGARMIIYMPTFVASIMAYIYKGWMLHKLDPKIKFNVPTQTSGNMPYIPNILNDDNMAKAMLSIGV